MLLINDDNSQTSLDNFLFFFSFTLLICEFFRNYLDRIISDNDGAEKNLISADGRRLKQKW